MPVERLERALEHPVGVGLGETAEAEPLHLVGAMGGDEQHRHLPVAGKPRDPGTVAIAVQLDVGEDEVELLPLDHLFGGGQAVDCGDDLVAGVVQQSLVVERDQRLVLHHHDPADQPFPLAKEHVSCRTLPFDVRAKRATCALVPLPPSPGRK